MGSEPRSQNFGLVKLREIIPRNPSYGAFFSWNFDSEFSKSSESLAKHELDSVLWPNSWPSAGLDNFLKVVAPYFEEIQGRQRVAH